MTGEILEAIFTYMIIIAHIQLLLSGGSTQSLVWSKENVLVLGRQDS